MFEISPEFLILVQTGYFSGFSRALNLTPEVRDILKILRKRGEIAPEQFEISEVEIMGVDCIFIISS